MGIATRNSILAVLLGVLLPLVSAWAEGFQAQPSIACEFMSEQGLRTGGDYRQINSVHECRSQRRNVIGGGRINNTIRFVARGDAERVTWLELELQVNSWTAVQRAHRALADYANVLLKAALDTELPGEVEAAILSAISGRWTVNDRLVTLERIVLGGPGYELHFGIR